MMKKLDQSGLIGIVALIITIMIIGWLVISRLTASQTANDVQQSGSEVIDDARDTVERANNASQNANDVIDQANDLVN